MKLITKFLMILALIYTSLAAQSYENDPLEDGYIIHDGGSQEIVTSEDNKVSIFKYYKEMQLAPWDTVVPVLRYEHGRSDGIYDLITSDLDGDSLNEIVKVWIKDDMVEIAVLKPDPNFLSIDSLAEWQKIVRIQKSSPVPVEGSHWYLAPVVLVDAGNFDSDPQKEFVIAYWADNGEMDDCVNLTVYDVDDTLGVFEKGSIMDQALVSPPEMNLCEDYAHLFEIECGDFNGDGIDEILLGGREPATPSGWQYFAKIYSYESASGNLVAQVKDTVYTQPDTLRDVANLNLAIGHFTTPDKEQAIIGFYQYDPFARNSQVADTVSYTLVPFEVNQQLTEINTGTIRIQKDRKSVV